MKKVKAVLASLAAAIALGVAFHNDLDKTLRKENPGGYSQQEVIFEKDRTDKILGLLIKANEKVEKGKVPEKELKKALKLAKDLVNHVDKDNGSFRDSVQARKLYKIVEKAHDDMYVKLSEDLRAVVDR